jgi:hypothetical protein
LKIDGLNINKTDLGLLNFDIEGNQSLDKFTNNSYLENNNLESFSNKWKFGIVNKETILDLKVQLSQFNLGF